MADIFQKQRLKPPQLRTVAARRFEDAKYLCDSERNARANGAIYLAGFVIECLLKAMLLEQYPWLQSAASPDGRPKPDQRLWRLCYRLHDLDEIVERLPGLQQKVAAAERAGHHRLPAMLKSVCGKWTIFARYSPKTADITEAYEFLKAVTELRRWLS